METSRPLRRLLLGPGGSPPVRVPARVLRYGVPLGILALVGLTAANVQYLRDTRHTAAWLAMLMSLGATVPMGLATRNPLAAWRIAYPLLVLTPLGAVADKEPWPWPPVQIVGFLLVLFLVAVTEGTTVTAWVTGLALIVPYFYTDQANAIGVTVLLCVIAVGGDVLARRDRSRRALAEQTELTELERARRAVLEERARIAREMHDVVAHHMSMIAVQAETAPYRLAGLDEPVRQELAGIATAARAALGDMRRLLGVLRADGQGAPRDPQPGLADVPELAATARRSGMTVTYLATGLEPVPAPIGLAAYRIVQEALANAARHAPESDVHVSLRALGDRLAVTVHNGPGTGTAPAEPGRGHGLRGMRERAELLGGELSAGPDGRDGYLVEASLPYATGGPDR